MAVALRRIVWLGLLACVASALIAPPAAASDWLRFRGPNGTGICPDTAPLPVEFGADKNLAWQIDLPGRGSSCPIVVGDKVFVTCWSGYGMGARDEDPGDQADLKRHLVCVDRHSGKILWDTPVDPYLPEDEYGGMFAEHGYASHTPVSDGERVYCYFGKTGAVAFDMAGNQLWKTQVGTESDPRNWGSASSPVLYKDLLIITASAESEALVGLDKKTGKEVWRQEASGLSGTWSTPILMEVDDERTDLVIGVPYEIWGINPENGKLRWHCKGADSNSFCASLVAGDGVVYAVDGRNGGGTAVRVGGEGDVTGTHVVWRTQERNRIVTPLLVDGRLCYLSGGMAVSMDATNGAANKARLPAGDAPAPPVGGGGGPGGRRGGRGVRSMDYASPIYADERIYFPSRRGDIYVVAPGDELEVLAVNRLSDDPDEDYSSSPAASDGQLFIRTSKRLYCVSLSSEGTL
ncbi:MAG: serine/threonine protein kinase [Planctomycetaceae bacterium]|nr:serine/threonine protein kinase [Planctomycetaceae bacterium]